jgi:hypothetical protein
LFCSFGPQRLNHAPRKLKHHCRQPTHDRAEDEEQG